MEGATGFKWYQTVEVCENGIDEHVLYEGYDREKALSAKWGREFCIEKERWSSSRVEVREYTIPEGKLFEELSIYEQDGVLSCYDLVDDEEDEEVDA